MKKGFYFKFEREATTWSSFINGGKANVEKIIKLKDIDKSKSAGLWEPHSGIRVGKLSIWARLLQWVNQSLRRISKSRKAIILAEGLINRTVCMLDESASKPEKKKIG